MMKVPYENENFNNSNDEESIDEIKDKSYINFVYSPSNIKK